MNSATRMGHPAQGSAVSIYFDAAAPTTYRLLRIQLRRATLSTVQPTAEPTCLMSYTPVCALSENEP